MSNELLEKINEYAIIHNVPVIEEPAGELLRKIVAEKQPKTILEIGTAIGYSGLLMLDSADENCFLTTVDVDDERLVQAEKNFKLAGVEKRVKIIQEDANYLLTLLDERFDFIFLDGPKGHYQTMFPYLLDLLADDGIIFVDDVGYHGWVDDGSYPKHKHRTIINNMRSFLKSVESDPNLKSQRIDVGQGVLIVQKC